MSFVVPLLVLPFFYLAYLGASVHPATPLCSPARLAPTYELGGAMGSDYLSVTLHNEAKAVCRLEGPPKVMLFDEAQHLMSRRVTWPIAVNAYGQGAKSLVLKAGESAVFAIQSSNRTGYGPRKHCAAKIRIYVPPYRTALLTTKIEACADVNITGYVRLPWKPSPIARANPRRSSASVARAREFLGSSAPHPSTPRPAGSAPVRCS